MPSKAMTVSHGRLDLINNTTLQIMIISRDMQVPTLLLIAFMTISISSSPLMIEEKDMFF
jgi:hypothetical protein